MEFELAGIARIGYILFTFNIVQALYFMASNTSQEPMQGSGVAQVGRAYSQSTSVAIETRMLIDSAHYVVTGRSGQPGLCEAASADHSSGIPQLPLH